MYPQAKLTYLPLRERPVYRVSRNANVCNLTELIAAIIGGKQQIEIAEALIKKFGNIYGISQAHVAEISSVQGIGSATAARLVAALALAQKLAEPAIDCPSINDVVDAAALVMDMGMLTQEHLRVILMNSRNRVIDIAEIYKGTVNAAMSRAAEILRPALIHNAPSIILVHNHPSGDPTPSRDDIVATRTLIEAGRLMDITVLDHLVIGRGRWFSLKRDGPKTIEW